MEKYKEMTLDAAETVLGHFDRTASFRDINDFRRQVLD
jgi:hypothetical protein